MWRGEPVTRAICRISFWKNEIEAKIEAFFPSVPLPFCVLIVVGFKREACVNRQSRRGFEDHEYELCRDEKPA
jgi:hypothetical protein